MSLPCLYTVKDPSTLLVQRWLGAGAESLCSCEDNDGDDDDMNLAPEFVFFFRRDTHNNLAGWLAGWLYCTVQEHRRRPISSSKVKHRRF